MRKKLMKLVSLALALVLTVSLLPAFGVSAAATTAKKLEQQIKRTYSKCRSSFGGSFDGYCGTMTSYQLYYLGLTAGRDRQNGNEGYDNYCKQKVSSGGYRITAYSGKKWSLKGALNRITDNGSKDAFNILVGFQSTPSRAGRRYGHSCIIHGIVDGRVYFVESYGVYLNGKRYREGAPLSCTIDEFCEYYASTTTKFDGVIHFGSEEYADKCQSYPTSFEARVTEDTGLRSQPSARDGEELSTLAAGQTVDVTAVLENTQGEFWYRVKGDTSGYIPAELLQVQRFTYEDITLEDVSAPTALRQGKSFQIDGEVRTENNAIYSVRSQVLTLSDDTEEQVFTTSDMVEDDCYSLKDSVISRELKFRELTPGSYRYELAAVIGSYYYEKDQLQVHWHSVPLWTSDFHVTEKKSSACQISFDSCGGSLEVNQISVVDGEPIGTLPVARRGEQVFLGWYTDPGDGQRITGEYQPEDDMTLYARWSTPAELEAAADTFWYVYADGVTAMGCAEIDGIVYYYTVADPSGLSGSVWTTGH